MAMAVLCLVGFQWYWITSALDLRNAQFNLKVTDALQEVVRKLEKQEIVYLIQQREQIEEQQRHLEALQKNSLAQRSTISIERMPKVYASNTQTPQKQDDKSDALIPRNRAMTDLQSSLINDFLKQRLIDLPQIAEILEIRREQERLFEKWFEEMQTLSTMGDSTMLPPMKNNLSKKVKLLTAHSIRKKIIQPNQTEVIKDVFKDLLFSKRPVVQRINRSMLDSLLKKALIERGINLPYEFAIRNEKERSILISTTTYNIPPKAQLYYATLFPNEINTSPNQLTIYFPDKQNFILSNMKIGLASSIALLAIILGCFYVAVSTILRQKKLADIKNDFVNNMTHEFKTPISTISLAVNMAQENPKPPAINRYLQIIQAENQRLGGHVEKVLQMALLDKGEIRLQKKPINIHNLIEKVLNTQSVLLEQHQVDLVLEFDAEDEIVSADETHLTNILTNLIDNAIKYSPEKVFLKISTKNKDNNLIVSVEDKGIGMTQEQQDKIFDSFYRVPTGNLHDVKGFGLGLSYVKKMIEAHNGTVTVESKADEGSIFSIVLPQAEG